MDDQKYLVKSAHKPTEDMVILELVNKNGLSVFNFKPGQYVMASYRNENGQIQDKHAFSIASSPGENHLRLGIKILGKFTQGLLKLKCGDEVFVSGPFGNFTYEENEHPDAVFIAGGIGITPFISVLKYATENNLSNKLSLIYSNRTVEGTIFFKEIKELEKENENLKTLFLITDEKIPPGIKDVLNEKINKRVIQDFVCSVSKKTFFICGPIKFMESVKNHLTALGVDKTRIITEEFAMISDIGFWPKLKNFSYAMAFSAAIMLIPFNVILSLAKWKNNNEFISSKQIYGGSLTDRGTEVSLVGSNSPDFYSPPAPTIQKSLTATTAVPIPTTSTSTVVVINNKSGPRPTASNNPAIPSAPQPTTSVSTPALATPPTTSNNPVFAPAPQPATSVSPVALVPPTAPTNNTPTVPAPVPNPTTSVSSAPAPTPTPAPVIIANPTPAPAPKPTTSISTSVPTTEPAPAPTKPSKPSHPSPIYEDGDEKEDERDDD